MSYNLFPPKKRKRFDLATDCTLTDLLWVYLLSDPISATVDFRETGWGTGWQMSETFNEGHVWEQERTYSVAFPGNWSSNISLHKFKITTLMYEMTGSVWGCANRMKYMDFTLYVFWYLSPTFLHTATCELMSSWDGLYNRNYRTFLTLRWALAWLLEKLCVQIQQLLSQTIQGDRFIQGLADSSEENAHGRCSPGPLHMFAIKLIYYDSRPTTIHALISICSVVRAVCSNLLLF